MTRIPFAILARHERSSVEHRSVKENLYSFKLCIEILLDMWRVNDEIYRGIKKGTKIRRAFYWRK